MNKPEPIKKLPHLDPHDPRVTAAVLKMIEEIPLSELDARLAHRNPGVTERQYPDPTPVTREELLRRQSEPSELGQCGSQQMKHTLRESLEDWTDSDGAAYDLAVCLGLMPEGIFADRAKHVFWSNNPIGNMLEQILDQLAEVGVLEHRDEPDRQFRWRSEFRGSWEEPYKATD